jgi:uncharacterized protein YdaU (DUF1376 family)
MSRLLPWFRFSADEWLLLTRRMPAEARGILIQLLAEQWHGGNGLPVEDAALFDLAGCTRKQWTRFKDQVLAKFQPKDGRLWNELLLNLQLEAQAKSEERSQSGKLGNRKRWGDQSHSDHSATEERSQTDRDLEVDLEVEEIRKEKTGGTLSRSGPPVNSSPSTSQSKPNGKSNGNSHSSESERTTSHLARAVANNLAVPDTSANLKSIEHAIKNECLVSHCSESQAAELIIEHTQPANFGTKAIRFYFEDADWRNDPNYSSNSCNLKKIAGGF